MLRRLFSTMIAVVCCMAASAQGVCVINGTIDNDRLSDGKKVKAVTLVRTNELGREIEVAKAKVKKGKYTFKQNLAQDEPILMYSIKGFGEGGAIEFFVEPGEVTINTPSAALPCASTVAGTPVNDTYREFVAILNGGYEEFKKQTAGNNDKDAVSRMESLTGIKTTSQAVRFLIDHNDSPMTPLMIERCLLHLLTPAYAEQMLKSIAFPLQEHPYYLSLRNKVLANNMKVGNEVPNITLSLSNGETTQLTDYRGKYVVLNFWTSDCEKLPEMLAELRKVHELIKDEQFVIISFALESDTAKWEEAIKRNNINLDGWLHACDGMGAESPAAKLFKVEETPQIILIEPEGRAVSLDMDIDEMIMRVEQILAGELYYLDNQE